MPGAPRRLQRMEIEPLNSQLVVDFSYCKATAAWKKLDVTLD